MKTSIAAISIFASGSMAVAKFVVGIAIGSLALISEALHSSVDLVATVITWASGAGVGPAGGRGTSLRPRQVREPVGARRHRPALRAGRWHPGRSLWPPARRRAAADHLGRSLYRPADRYRHESTGGRARCTAPRVRPKARRSPPTPCILPPTCSAPSPSSPGSRWPALGFRWGDAAAAIAVAVMIALLGLRMARATVETLLDRAPEGAAETAEAAIRAVPGRGRRRTVAACGWSGRPISSTPSSRFPAPIRSTASRRSSARRRPRSARRSAMPTSPCRDAGCANNESVRERIMVIARNSGLAIHHVTVHDLGGRLIVSIDLEVDGEMALTAAHDIAQALEPTSARNSARRSRSTPISNRWNRSCRSAPTLRRSASRPSRRR